MAGWLGGWIGVDTAAIVSSIYRRPSRCCIVVGLLVAVFGVDDRCASVGSRLLTPWHLVARSGR